MKYTKLETILKCAFLFILFFQVSFSLSAKKKFGVDLGVGVKAGLNFNKVEGKAWKDIYSTDPHAGFFMFLNKHRLGFQLEAVWTQNKITTDSTFYGLYKQYLTAAADSLNSYTFRFNTISIPILLNIKLARFLWIQAGPQYSANINLVDKNKIIKSGIDIIKEGSFNWVGGLWLQFGGDAPVLRINAGVRYISGLNSINNLVSLNETRPEWRNQMIQVHLGISY